jgi:dynein assembly factor 5
LFTRLTGWHCKFRPNTEGTPEITEDSEEVRLLLVDLACTIIKRCPDGLALYMDEYIQILQKTVSDPFADVMKLSTSCIRMLAVSTQERFHMGSKPLHKPLIAMLAHQHSRVRVAGIQAIESVCLYGENTAINDFMVCLAQKSMDAAPTVRKALYIAVGTWMMYGRLSLTHTAARWFCSYPLHLALSLFLLFSLTKQSLLLRHLRGATGS